MDAKLTLRLDADIIERVKIYASKHQKSISALTEELYKSLLSKTLENYDSDIRSPVAGKYKGVISSADFEADTQKAHFLWEKHLVKLP
ncbi:MAG: hypothetical protein HQM10_19005 [Candidatus Riflebacteria bacterium]|nr:hypothetical protein [Candidatus Riflebacteria bacterium]